jgi:hypothetical protein
MLGIRMTLITPMTLAPPTILRTSLVWAGCLAAGWLAAHPLVAQDHPGLAVYREHCGRCHGDSGTGTPDVPEPRSTTPLAAIRSWPAISKSPGVSCTVPRNPLGWSGRRATWSIAA